MVDKFLVELQAQLDRIEKQKELIIASRTALTPRLELIVHMAQSRQQVLTFRKQLSPQPATLAPAAVANTP